MYKLGAMVRQIRNIFSNFTNCNIYEKLFTSLVL
jgi:hypothetical protein